MSVSVSSLGKIGMVTMVGRLNMFVLLASASNTYIGSVLFRTSAFTGAKLASGVPGVTGRFWP